MLLAETIGIIIFLSAEFFLSFFTRDPEVIFYGVTRSRIISLLLFPMALSHVMAGLYRGAGKAIVPMSVMLSIWCVFRIIFIRVGLSLIWDIRVIFWAYPISWIISSIIFIIYYFRVDWMGQYGRTTS